MARHSIRVRLPGKIFPGMYVHDSSHCNGVSMWRISVLQICIFIYPVLRYQYSLCFSAKKLFRRMLSFFCVEKHEPSAFFINYIKCAARCRLEIISNPLTPSEEKYYIQRYTEGDLNAKHILIERNLRLVAHVIKKYQNLEEDPEDLLSIGTIGLIKAVVTFNPDKGNRLAAYASRCVENEILMYLRAKKKSAKEISLYEPSALTGRAMRSSSMTSSRLTRSMFPKKSISKKTYRNSTKKSKTSFPLEKSSF